MDGRVAAIREQLPETPIVAYSAKYASAFYGPFRKRPTRTGVRRPAQLPDGPGQRSRSPARVRARFAEGADVLMVKPALPYLDVIRAVRAQFDAPVAAYNALGEYAMCSAARWMDERRRRSSR